MYKAPKLLTKINDTLLLPHFTRIAMINGNDWLCLDCVKSDLDTEHWILSVVFGVTNQQRVAIMRWDTRICLSLRCPSTIGQATSKQVSIGHSKEMYEIIFKIKKNICHLVNWMDCPFSVCVCVAVRLCCNVFLPYSNDRLTLPFTEI